MSCAPNLPRIIVRRNSSRGWQPTTRQKPACNPGILGGRRSTNDAAPTLTARMKPRSSRGFVFLTILPVHPDRGQQAFPKSGTVLVATGIRLPKGRRILGNTLPCEGQRRCHTITVLNKSKPLPFQTLRGIH